MLEREDELCTSTLTLGEVLVKPLDRDAARRYAEIRLTRGIRPPDAIQLACASRAGVDLFITNDDRLSRLTIPGIRVLASLDHAFL